MSDLVIVSDTRKIVEVELPSFPGGKVSMVTDLLLGDVRKFNGIKDNFEKAIEMMIASIKDWNLAEKLDDGSVVKMAITKENIDKFPQEDIKLLLATSQGITVEELEKRGRDLLSTEKKNSLS